MASVMDSVDQRTQLAGHNRLELLLFKLNGRQRFGINVFKIQEVVHCPPLTQIPHSHSVVRGVATMRGKTIPVIDLGMAIGRAPVEDLSNSFMIVAEYNRSTQGFLVAGVERIVNLNWGDILPPPKGSGKDSYLTAVTRFENELIEIIDVEKVLAEVCNAPTEVSQALTENIEEKIRQQHVLVVDDSNVARNQVKRTLEQIGVECSLANNGRGALALLREWADNNDPRLEHLAVVVSDIEMPEMDGYTLTTEIRKDERFTHLYIMLHTSLSGTFNNAMVVKVGANKFIPKFKPDELAGAVVDRIKAFVEEKGY
ncbi:chemotaxis protein CheW [Candidatus Tenderia electrophaga]|uniref:Chemotaxis protein CheW n=1 Tax=Candidatus Tenderia electrophaga TaxID=1748243 RepID=A0A0S2TBT4_9GAMM|nr:chemotaxis protein CheW [Candidatus Tenderia electrophaga]